MKSKLQSFKHEHHSDHYLRLSLCWTSDVKLHTSQIWFFSAMNERQEPNHEQTKNQCSYSFILQCLHTRKVNNIILALVIRKRKKKLKRKRKEKAHCTLPWTFAKNNWWFAGNKKLLAASGSTWQTFGLWCSTHLLHKKEYLPSHACKGNQDFAILWLLSWNIDQPKSSKILFENKKSTKDLFG